MLIRCLRIAALLVLVGGTALGAGQAPAPQGDQAAASGPVPTFKAQVEYVEVDALVTDAQGRPVRGLTKDDFQVFEDGKRQTISSFVFVDIPVERRRSAAVPAERHRAGRRQQRAALRRPRLRPGARRLAHRAAANRSS